MEKKQIEKFIRKYHLNGAIEGVLWQNDNDNLSVTAMTSDRKLFASVQLEKAAAFFDKGVEIGIQNTSKLKKMLTPLSDNISISLDFHDGSTTSVRQLIGEDGKNTIKYVCAAKDVIGSVPTMKNIPTFDVEIVLNTEFISTFEKSFSAINDSSTLFTLIMSKKKQKLEMVLGYKQNLSDQIAMEVEATVGKDTVKNPISFNAQNLKEILSANSDVENPILSVSEAGLATINFINGDFKSQYYLVKIDVED